MITRMRTPFLARSRHITIFLESDISRLRLRQFSSQSDDKDSPAGVSAEAKTVSFTDEDNAVIEAVTSAKRSNVKQSKSFHGLQQEKTKKDQQSSWIRNAIKKNVVQPKSDSKPESVEQFSEAVKALKKPSQPSPLDIIDDSFFRNSRSKAKAGKDKSSRDAWQLKPEDFDGKIKDAARNVTARAGEASLTLEEELLKGLSHLDLKTRRRQAIQAYKSQTSSAPDLDVLNSIDVDQLAPSTPAQPKLKQKPHRMRSGADLDLLEKINVNEVLSQFPMSKADHKGFRMEPKSPQAFGRAKMYSNLNELLSQPPLNIFSEKLEVGPGHTMKLWSTFEQNELRRNTCFEPSNWWAQCIQWTEEGKMWHFPIDNEQGMVEEETVDFTEHVFLDQHIESWCPKKGPIKHFMELVLIGLSKNPYLSVPEKIEYIEWFEKYFDKHKILLQEINVLDSNHPPLLESKVSKPSA